MEVFITIKTNVYRKIHANRNRAKEVLQISVRKVYWIRIFHQLKKEKRCLDVRYVAKAFLRRQNWLSTIVQSMKEKNHLGVKFVITAVRPIILYP